MKFAALLLALVVLPAAAEFTIVEETDTVTVYREGDQLIVLVDPGADLQDIARQRAQGEVTRFLRIKDKTARQAGVKFYMWRTRLIDGNLVCEKLANRPAAELREYVRDQVAAGRCAR